ncbi:MAG: hypothetical protein WC295_13370 [Methanoregula sp.]|jgi:hypothetical protein
MMEIASHIQLDENWRVLLQFLPPGWELKARELGAVTRQRKIPSAEILLRILFIHLAEGYSLRETVIRAKDAKLADISDVALYKRLKASSEWLRWLAERLACERYGISGKPNWLNRFFVRIVDSQIIAEHGNTGSDWRLQYSIGLSGFMCDHFQVTDLHTGGNFRSFPVRAGYLLIGDQGFDDVEGLEYVMKNRGDFLVRGSSGIFRSLQDEEAVSFLRENVRHLEYGEIGDFDLSFRFPNDRLQKIRVCAIKISPEAARRSEDATGPGMRGMPGTPGVTNDETTGLPGYLFVITSVDREVLSGAEVLSVYRMRWQVGVAFRRLRSLLELGLLPKTDPESARAWLYGKMVVALLLDALAETGCASFPWGYPLRQRPG